MSAKMQVMFAVPRVFAVRNTIQSVVRCKLTKAEFMKQLQKDNKALLGGLVETRKQKLAREKREKKSRTLKQSAVDLSKKKPETDSEAYYTVNAANQEYVRIKFMRECVPNQTKRILKITRAKVKTDEAAESSPTIDSAQNSVDFQKTTSDGNVVKKPSLFPSDVLINRITSFSYLNVNKNVENNSERAQLLSISPYSDRSKLAIPSVTRILNKTMSPESKLNLELWKQRMILELGEEGFEKYSKELLNNGKQFHSSIQNYLTEKPFDVPSTVEKSWQSVQHVLKDVHQVHAIESHVVHSKLYYRGIVDCVAMYRGNLCVVDWKKSDKPKNSIENTFDAPIQVASYIGALNSDANYNFQVQKGLVIVGYTNGDPASVHEINPDLLNKYWKLWLRRLQQYYVELTSSNQDSVAEDKK